MNPDLAICELARQYGARLVEKRDLLLQLQSDLHDRAKEETDTFCALLAKHLNELHELELRAKELMPDLDVRMLLAWSPDVVPRADFYREREYASRDTRGQLFLFRFRTCLAFPHPGDLVARSRKYVAFRDKNRTSVFDMAGRCHHSFVNTQGVVIVEEDVFVLTLDGETFHVDKWPVRRNDGAGQRHQRVEIANVFESLWCSVYVFLSVADQLLLVLGTGARGNIIELSLDLEEVARRPYETEPRFRLLKAGLVEGALAWLLSRETWVGNYCLTVDLPVLANELLKGCVCFWENSYYSCDLFP